MTRRRRPSCLPGLRPPDHEPRDLAVVDRAYQRAMRRARRLTLLSLIPVTAIQTALYLLGVNGVVLALWPMVVATGISMVVARHARVTP